VATVSMLSFVSLNVKTLQITQMPFGWGIK
jgi:hypothetical protein